MKKVLLVEPIDLQAYSYLKEHTILIESLEDLSQVEYIITRNLKLNQSFLEKCFSLKKIIVHGSGFDDVDCFYCKKHHIEVVSTPGKNSQSVSELMLLLTLDVLRKVTYSYRYLQTCQQFENAPLSLQGHELLGKTVGFLGSGMVVQKAIPLFKAFQTRILAYSPHLENKIINVEKVNFNTLLKESDILIVAVPLNESTYHMIGENELALMKKEAILINIARGAIVDEMALFNALKDKKVAGAGLDVIENEPLEKTNAFLTLPQVVVTPHIGGNTKEALYRIGQAIIHEINH